MKTHVAILVFAFAFAVRAESPVPFMPVGSFTRSIFVFDLYQVNFSIGDDTGARPAVAGESLSLRDKTDRIAERLLSGSAGTDLMLELRVLTPLKDYSGESRIFDQVLDRSGLRAQARCPSTGRPGSLERDIDSYRAFLLGIDARDPSSVFSKRRPGSKVVMYRSGHASGIRYLEDGRPPVELAFETPALILGVMRTFLSFSYCAEELRERMPARLLARLLI